MENKYYQDIGILKFQNYQKYVQYFILINLTNIYIKC